MITALAVLSILCALADWLFTIRRIDKYGLGVEMNPAIRWLTKFLSPSEATFLTIVLSSWVLITVGIAFQAKIPLALFAGARLFWNWQQLASLRCEKMLDEWLKEINGQANKSD